MINNIQIAIISVLFLALALCLKKTENYSIFPWFRTLTEEQKKNINFKYIKKYASVTALVVSVISFALFLLTMLANVNYFYILIAEGCLIFLFLLVYIFMLKKSCVVSKWDFFSVIFFLAFILLIGLSKFF